MTLECMLGKIAEYIDVDVYDVYGNPLGTYDGRNSIDPKYDAWIVHDFMITHERVAVWIDTKEL